MKKIRLEKSDMSLEILNEKHIQTLSALAIEKAIWQYAPDEYYHPDVFKEKWINKAIKQTNDNQRVCYVISYKNNIVGSSSYYDIDLANKKTHIGYTWFTPSVWGTSVNTLSKLIMLEYAFETLKLNRVEFCIDSLNERSCNAVQKLGAKYEGVLRNHLILANNRIRHSVIFSVINDEWAEVKSNITKKIILEQIQSQ